MSRLDLGFHFHPKEILENGVRTHVNSKGKSLQPEAQRMVETATLHHTGQRTNTLPTELFYGAEICGEVQPMFSMIDLDSDQSTLHASAWD